MYICVNGNRRKVQRPSLIIGRNTLRERITNERYNAYLRSTYKMKTDEDNEFVEIGNSNVRMVVRSSNTELMDRVEEFIDRYHSY